MYRGFTGTSQVYSGYIRTIHIYIYVYIYGLYTVVALEVPSRGPSQSPLKIEARLNR